MANRRLPLFITIICVALAFLSSTRAAESVTAPKVPHDFLAPAVDHHQHLLSPALATLWSTNLTHASVPQPVAELVSDLGKAWNNEAALAVLYVHDSVLIEPRSDELIRGRSEIAVRLAHLFQAAYKLVPASFHVEGRAAYLVVYLERPRGAADLPFGEALITIQRGANRKWRVVTETLKIPGPSVLMPFEAKDLLLLLDQAGIQRAVVLSGAYAFSDKSLPKSPDEYANVRAENDWTAQQVAQFPERLVAFCGLNPIRDYALEEIRRCFSELNMKGLKLHFSNSGVVLTNPEHLTAVQAVFQEANRLRIPIVAHLQTQTEYGAREARIFLNDVLSKAPDIVVQIAHMAGSGPGWNDEAMAVYADAIRAGDPRTAKLYFDVATVAEGQSYGRLVILAERIRQVGIERILYGSDASFSTRPTPRQQWAMFQGYVPISQGEISAIAQNVAPYLK